MEHLLRVLYKSAKDFGRLCSGVSVLQPVNVKNLNGEVLMQGFTAEL